ncbi:MAG: hypothetical protein IJZ29_05680 [Clostridia bacterium]|nr:hypothetical protein [Clostridia bacterium]
MTKYKISLIPIVLLLLSTLLFGCATKMEAKEVYSHFIEYAKADDNIFEVVNAENPDNLSVEIKIGYTQAIDQVLVTEREQYQQTGTPISDFYLLKEVYEPTLNFAMNFFLTNLNVLNKSSKSITQEEAGVIYDSFYNLKKSISSFQNTLESLNYYEDRFTSGQYKEKSDIVYKQLETFKIKYANMINDAFDLNNKFIDLYYSIYNTVDYRVETTTEFDGLYLQMLCNQSVAKLAQVGFMVDGIKCNFLNTNMSSFEILIEESVIDHTYIEHLEQISDTAKTLVDIPATAFQALDGNNDMKAEVMVLQTQLETFDKQYSKFKKALGEINYRDYIASGKTLEEYGNTLSDSKKSYLYVVEHFLNNNYASLCQIIDTIISNVK